jgi:hypothetical protein
LFGSNLHLAARHQDGKWALLYLADQAQFSVDLSKITAAKVNASWLDPRTGEAVPLKQETNTGTKTFSTPDGWEDALLLLEAG